MLGFIPVKDEAEQVQMMRLLTGIAVANASETCSLSGVAGIVFVYNNGEKFASLCETLRLSDITLAHGRFSLRLHSAEVWVNRPGFLQKEVSRVTFDGIQHMGWEGENKARANALLLEFSDAIGRPVLCSIPHKSTRAVRSDKTSFDLFEVLIWSSPRGPCAYEPPEHIWGYKTACRDPSYHPTGEGIAIVDDATGWCVAELFPHQLYVHHDLCHNNRVAELEIFELLLREVLLRMVPAVVDSEAALLRKFQTLCNRGHARVLEETRTSIDADEQKLKRLQQELVQVRGRLDAWKLRLAQLEGVVSDADRQATTFATLRNHRMVAAMKIEHGVIEVITPRLYAVDPRTSVIHRLGVQVVTIHRDGKNGGVRFVCREGNISGTGRAVPHVTKEGFLVHPDALPAIAELLAYQKFDEVFDVAIQAATEVVSDHPQGADIAKWPHATPAELIGTEWEGQQVSAAA